MKISIIGTGNVAGILGAAFIRSGISIAWIYGRDPVKARRLAKKFKTIVATDLNMAGNHAADIIIIAVKDDAIAEVARLLKTKNCLVAHTSGSVALTALTGHHKICGVFYPVQTFSKAGKTSLAQTPICIESNTEKGMQLLLKAASAISSHVYITDSNERRRVHLAAVFANNFTNHLFKIASSILEEQHLSFDLLRPIILSAAKNLQHASPDLLQTGPAVRGDSLTEAKHLKMLKTHPEWQRIYDLISQDIRRK
jgi:predicted short-subunit dehydrogenase-like oxidoreductase (DUF2520 family)